MAQAIKTMGAILNDASEGMARDMEGARRSALTGVQLKGEVADQQWKEDERSRTRAYLDDAKALGRQKLTKRVPRQNQQAAIPTGQPGEVVAPVEYDDVPIDLSSPEGIKAVGEYQSGLFQLRVKHGLAAPDEAEKMVGFRRKLDQLGVTQDFEAALKGDADALVRVSKLAGLDNVARIAVGFDDIGDANLYAFTRKSDGKGGIVESKVPIGHLAAAVSKEFYDATVGTARAEVKAREELKNDASTRTYQDRQGRAALQNAETSASRYTRQSVLNDEYMAFTREISDNPKNWLAPNFKELGEQAIDDKGASVMRTLGMFLIKEQGLNSGRALMQASTDFAKLNTAARGLYDRELSEAKVAAGADSATEEDKMRYRNLQRNGVQRWQQIRDQLLDATLADIRQSAN